MPGGNPAFPALQEIFQGGQQGAAIKGVFARKSAAWIPASGPAKPGKLSANAAAAKGAPCAEIAALRLGEIGFSPSGIEKIRHVILAKQKHAPATDVDTNFLTDADRSILGQNREIHWNYAESMQREYAMFSAPAYAAGRIKALQSFLARPAIFKTRHFHEKFERQARKNLTEEIARMSAAESP
jgi:predicted metal-dependent HD superfamily phosphohydrolase